MILSVLYKVGDGGNDCFWKIDMLKFLVFRLNKEIKLVKALW